MADIVMYMGVIFIVAGISSAITYKHRFVMHDLVIGNVIFLLPLFYNLPRELFWVCLLGLNVGHYFLDFLTYDGIRFFLMKLRSPIVIRGSVVEPILVGIFCILIFNI